MHWSPSPLLNWLNTSGRRLTPSRLLTHMFKDRASDEELASESGRSPVNQIMRMSLYPLLSHMVKDGDSDNAPVEPPPETQSLYVKDIRWDPRRYPLTPRSKNTSSDWECLEKDEQIKNGRDPDKSILVWEQGRKDNGELSNSATCTTLEQPPKPSHPNFERELAQYRANQEENELNLQRRTRQYEKLAQETEGVRCSYTVPNAHSQISTMRAGPDAIKMQAAVNEESHNDMKNLRCEATRQGKPVLFLLPHMSGPTS